MMKKTVLILVLLVPILLRMSFASEESLLTDVENNNSSKQEKNKNWEFIKENLFKNSIEREYGIPKKIKGILLFELKNASYVDSLATDNVLQKLKKIIPNKKIDYLPKYNKSKIKPSVKISFETSKLVNKRGANEGTQQLFFSFTENTTLQEREKYIQYEVLKTICFAHKTENEIPLLNIRYPVNAIFNDPVYSVLDKEITKNDEFLVQKLYTNDFETQFSDYMYATYPWRYAGLFVNKDRQEFKVYLLIGVFGVLILLMSFQLLNIEITDYKQYFFTLFVVFVSVINLYGLYEFFIEINQPVGTVLHILTPYLYVLLTTLFIAVFLWFIEKKLVLLSVDFTTLFGVKLLLTLFILNLPVWLSYFFTKGEAHRFMPHYIPLFYIFLALTLARGLLMYLNHYSKTLVHQKEIELTQLQEVSTRNELKSLHARINPHFLYNALNSITGLICENPKKAEETIVGLSDLFRYSINRTNKNMNTVADEILMIESYLKIEKIRFGERLQYSVAVKEELLEKEIPMFLIQPLIENTIKHGVATSKTAVTVALEIKKENKELLILVKDTGHDFPEDLYGGYGLQSISDLLRINYKDKALLKWTNEPEKEIRISIPL